MTTSDSKLWARSLAVASIAAAGILLSSCSLLTQFTGGGGTDSGTGDPAAGTEDDVFSLVVGDCFNEETDAETVSTVDIVECSVPHAWEAYAAIEMDQAEYPGDEETQTQADQVCYDPFTEYVGVDVDTSIYNYSFYYPTAETWADPVLQDREILCLGFADDDSDLTGSIEGTNE